jgi:hypothetical protein
MEHQERRAALSAFFWTISVMSIAGGLLFWQSDNIPTIPLAQANAAAVTQYANALDTANIRLTEAGNRITILEQELTQQSTPSQPQSAVSESAAPATDITSQQALESARTIVGSLAPMADPELVDLEGQTVWSIPYQPGIVFVSARDGTILLVQRTQPERHNEQEHDEQNESDHDD